MEKHTFGDRLKSERKRLGFTQEQLAELGGVKKLAQINYEKDKTFPDAGYLMRIKENGVDVVFLLDAGIQSDTLSADESQLITTYRLMEDAGKLGVKALMLGLNQANPPTVENKFNGDVGQVVNGDVNGPQTFTFNKKTKK